MPRRSKGVRLWLRPARRDGEGAHRSTWIIDGARHVATGCPAHEIAAAEDKLASYITGKYQPARKERDIEQIDVADVLSIYDNDCGGRQRNRRQFDARLARLNEFWGGKKLSEVTGETCREYAKWRGSAGGARRDLEDLRAAINHHSKEGFHRGIVRILLPRRGGRRMRWLNRKEAADLLRVCWRAHEVQTVHRGPNKGQKIKTERRPLRHLARFILIGLYTGTRASAIAAASFHRGLGRSFVDVERGLFYRLAEGQLETKKRQTPVPIPPRLLAHLRRWAAKSRVDDHVVEWSGSPVKSVKTAFNSAVRQAKLEGRVSPHTLRHTAATWLMQAGVDKWEAAGFLGMTVEMLDRVYGHHHPDYLRTAARAIGYRHRRDSLAEPLAGRQAQQPLTFQPFEIAGGPGSCATA
jgi:integrase